MRVLTFWTLFLISTTLAGQTLEKHYAYSVGGSVSKGYIIKHNANIGNLAISHPQAFQLYVNKHTFGKKYCEQYYHYPDLSLSFTYFNYLNPVLGKSFTLTPSLNVPVLQFSKSTFRFKLGAGLAYHTNPYHPIFNHRNIALGTPLTFTLVTGLMYDYSLTALWHGGLSASLTHFSNGAYSKPNTGINVPSLDLLVSRKIKPVALKKQSWAEQKDQYCGIYYYLGASTGIKEIEYGGDKYSFLNLHFLASKRFNAISAINLGMDAFLDNGLKAYIEQEVKEGHPDYRRVGIVVGHELFYDRLSLLTQIGTYIYRPFKGVYGAGYQRYGLRYAVTNHLIASVNLVTHAGQAELVEWGIGLNF